MILSAVWTLILAAPIHSRGSIGHTFDITFGILGTRTGYISIETEHFEVGKEIIIFEIVITTTYNKFHLLV